MKHHLFAIATGLSLAATALMGQGGDLQPATFQFQSVTTMGGPITMTSIGGRGGIVTGSPMSGKQVNKTVQTLSDGTELENTHTTMFYRDSQGRTRTEPQEPNTTVVIQDPVAGLRIMLNPSSRTANRMQAATMMSNVRTAAPVTVTTSSDLTAQQAKIEGELAAVQDALKVAVAGGTAVAGRVSSVAGNKPNVEDLGFQMQNGVMAQGTRSTLIIPQGQIGNSRDIHVVNERWYSKDLQMIVKSINSDPRFGVTTFELTGLSQNAPDPTLFQIPTGYTINEGGGRGARGGVGVSGGAGR